MFNLLSAECYKLKKSRNLFVCIIVVFVMVFFIYGMLVLAEKIQQGEIANGTGGVVVTENGEPVNGVNVAESLIQSIGAVDVIQQLFAGDFIAVILAVFVSIMIVGEYGSGAIKNIVGKGYTRGSIYLAKFTAAALGVCLLLLFGIAVSLLGAVLILGTDVFYAGIWKDIAIFSGLQLLICLALSAVFSLIAEIGRNIAAGISISIGIAIFASILFSGLDMIFIHTNVHPSEYWLMNMSMTCPVSGFEAGYIGKTVCTSIFWLAAALAAGIWHFKKADIK